VIIKLQDLQENPVLAVSCPCSCTCHLVTCCSSAQTPSCIWKGIKQQISIEQQYVIELCAHLNCFTMCSSKSLLQCNGETHRNTLQSNRKSHLIVKCRLFSQGKAQSKGSLPYVLQVHIVCLVRNRSK
jgi:hypothetical protein